MCCIEELLACAATSMSRSLQYYWPADADGKNDCAENNLTLHVAHACLARRFAVFAEADHPLPDCQGVDLLSVAPNRTAFVAFEFKRHINRGLRDSATDINRVRSFELNQRLRLERCGPEPIRVISKCRVGYGVVAGLRWHSGLGGPELEDDSTAQRIIKEGGHIGVIPVHEFRPPASQGSYWIQYGYFSWKT